MAAFKLSTELLTKLRSASVANVASRDELKLSWLAILDAKEDESTENAPDISVFKA